MNETEIKPDESNSNLLDYDPKRTSKYVSRFAAVPFALGGKKVPSTSPKVAWPMIRTRV